MGMQIRCRCGASLVVSPGTPTVVCAGCRATVAVPQPERELALDETIPAFEARAAMQLAANATVDTAPPPAPAPAPRAARPASSSALPWVVLALVVVGAGIALVLIATRDGTPAAESPPAAAQPGSGALSIPGFDGGHPAPERSPPATSPEELVVFARTGLARGSGTYLRPLLAENAFAHGLHGAHVAYTGAATAAMIDTMFGGASTITSTWSKINRVGNEVAWIVDELERAPSDNGHGGGPKQRLMTSLLAARDADGSWRIAAWHVAELVGNKRAFDLAKAGQLPQPAAITDQFDDDHQVHDAFRAAFATREAFVAAFSDSRDAIDLGSAPGERVVGGAAVKRTFTSIPAVFALHDGVAAGRVGDRIGWAAANVDYTIEGKGTQTFRVLAVLVRERAGWRIVLAQWSNAGPLP